MPSAELYNRLLATLTPVSCEHVLRESQLVELPIRTQLCGTEEAPRYVYLLTSGVASLIFTSERGTTVELATLGTEGLVGWLALLGPQTGPVECLMLVAGEAYRIPLRAARLEFLACEEFRNRVLEFAQHQTFLSNQIVACNRLHKAEARLARWLLMVQDRIHDDTIHMTQEFLSAMLGTRRTTIVEVAAILENGGAIAHRRGRVSILDREKLKGFACECYPVLKRLLDELYVGKTDARIVADFNP